MYRRSPNQTLNQEAGIGYETQNSSSVSLTAKGKSPDLKLSKKSMHRIMISNQHKFA